MDIGAAITAAKQGKKIARTNWNGQSQFVVFQKGYPEGIPANKNTSEALNVEEGTVLKFRPYLMIRTVDGSFVPWLASMSDLLETDWVELD
ncbi:MAG: DUF2829 domain-containing protein [Chitinophagaceae bacterium]